MMFIVWHESDYDDPKGRSGGFEVLHWSEQEEEGPDTALNHEEAATVWAEKHLNLTASVWAPIVVRDPEGVTLRFTVSIRVQLCYDVEEK